MKQLMAGAGVAIVGMGLVPLLSGLFSVSPSIGNPCPSRFHAGGAERR